MSDPSERDRVVLVTGATGLIGRSLTAGLLAAGWDVIALSRSREHLAALEEQTAEARAAAGSTLYGWTADLEANDLMERLEGYLERSPAGFPTAIVHNARDLGHLAVADDGEIPTAGWLGEFRLGVEIPYRLTMFLADHPESRLESVVHVGSIYGMVAPHRALHGPAEAPPPHYGVVKAALVHLTRDLAVRLAPREIRVNCVSFGGVLGRATPELAARYAELAPQGRMLDPAETVGPVLFLLSDGASAVTGQNLPCEGGWTLW